MSAKHTPRPWFPSQILDDGRWGIITAQNEIVVGVTQALTIENARLIATVHDLLAALRELHAVCVDMDLENQNDRPTEEQYCATMDAARVAIAKATGDAT